MNYKAEMEMIRKEWFQNHRATITNTNGSMLQHIVWQKPGTNIGRMEVLISRNLLVVAGDLGDAIFKFSGPISIEAIAKLTKDGEISYFASKCTASECGKGYQSWDEEVAKKKIEEWKTSGLLTKEYYYQAVEACASHHEWILFLNDHGPTALDEQWYEHDNMGMRPDIRCVSYLVAFQMIQEQIDKEQAE